MAWLSVACPCLHTTAVVLDMLIKHGMSVENRAGVVKHAFMGHPGVIEVVGQGSSEVLWQAPGSGKGVHIIHLFAQRLGPPYAQAGVLHWQAPTQQQLHWQAPTQRQMHWSL